MGKKKSVDRVINCSAVHCVHHSDIEEKQWEKSRFTQRERQGK